MPKVQQYTADASVGGPYGVREARDLDTGNVGAQIENIGNTISNVGMQIHKQQAQSEITKLAATMAKAHANFSGDLDDALQTADPNDDKISENFMSDYDNQMQDVSKNIKTPEAQRYFDEANAQMRGHFQIASMQGQSALAGHAAVENLNQASGQLSASVYNDPSALPQVLLQSQMGIQALAENGTIDQVTAEKLKQQANRQIVEASVRGWINPDGANAPEKALSDLKAGKYDQYLDGSTRYQLQREGDQAINAREVESNRQAAAAKEALKEVQDKTMSGMLNKIYNNGLGTSEVLSNRNLSFTQKNEMLRIIESAANNKIKDDPNVYTHILAQITQPEYGPPIRGGRITDPQDLYAFVGRGLTLKSAQDFQKILENKSTPQGKAENTELNNFIEHTAKTPIAGVTPINPIGDPEGLARYQSFLSAFLPKYQQMRAAGKTPEQLLDPKSSDSLFPMVQQFAGSPEERMAAYGAQLQKNAAQASTPTTAQTPSATLQNKITQRLPGETYSQWKKRTGQ